MNADDAHSDIVGKGVVSGARGPDCAPNKMVFVLKPRKDMNTVRHK